MGSLPFCVGVSIGLPTLKASCVFFVWTCMTFLCYLSKPTMKRVRQHINHQHDNHMEFAVITGIFNCHLQCEQIHFPSHNLLGYKRLVLSGLVTWLLPYLFAAFFLLFIIYLEPTPFKVKTKTVCSVTQIIGHSPGQ